MSISAVAFLISGGGLILSIISAVAIVSMRYGTLREQVRELQAKQNNMVTKDDLTPIKESLAEIRGMFRLELKEK